MGNIYSSCLKDANSHFINTYAIVTSNINIKIIRYFTQKKILAFSRRICLYVTLVRKNDLRLTFLLTDF